MIKTTKEFVGSVHERGVGIEWCENLKVKVYGQLGIPLNSRIERGTSPTPKI